MKKEQVIPNCEFSRKKIFFVMRLTAFFILASCMHVSAASPSQKSNTDKSEQNQSFAQQPQKKQIKGKITDDKGEPIQGATILIKGSTVGTIADVNGNFSLAIPDDAKTLVFSFIGMKSQEMTMGNKTSFNVVLEDQAIGLEDVVVVGYGTQKKASVVGSITQATGEALKRSGGVPNLGLALTGNLPGVTAIQTSYQPGESDPKIVIRGQSSWNNTDPYILVDGVERRMNDIDMNEVESVSVLKDASATAVFGVKGANGVILITTKRGVEGKAVFSVSANTTVVLPSRLVDKLDAYDAFMVKDAAIERESVINPSSWEDYQPFEIARRYRNPGNYQNLKYPEAFPNVDWQDYMLRDYTLDHRVNMNASGGTKIVKYFASLAYMSQDDLMDIPNILGYKAGFGYDRFNFRSNLDINITPTTILSLNMSGNYGVQKAYNTSGMPRDQYALAGLYNTPPDVFLPVYEDGRYGTSTSAGTTVKNPLTSAATEGYDITHKMDVNTDILLKQKLDFITKGLSATVRFSFDNSYASVSGISDKEGFPTKALDPGIEDAAPGTESNYIDIGPIAGINQFPWAKKPYTVKAEAGQLSSIKRRLFYQAQINYSREFGKHDVAATAVVNREEYASGSQFPNYREDWVFRATYNYDTRYFIEANGAYNGSEKFGPEYRFAFFPSMGLGWSLNNEAFLKDVKWLDKLKLRYNIGIIGDDNISDRWLYMSQYVYGGNLSLSNVVNTKSPYTIYKEGTTGSPNIHWEQAKKTNYGVEMAVLKNQVSISFDYFTENRTDILLTGSNRVFPPYYNPVSPPAGNVGRVNKEGYELELHLRKPLSKNFSLEASFSMAHVTNKIIFKEEPLLKESHLLDAGFALGQTKSTISNGFMTSWDEIYANPSSATNNEFKLPGDIGVLDFDANGVIEGSKDLAANGYSTVPQNTFNSTLSAHYKGFSAMVQFYGVTNVTRNTSRNFYVQGSNIAYAHALDYWSLDNPNGTSYLPRWEAGGGSDANFYNSDGSYLRLKNAEVAYTFDKAFAKNFGISSCRLYLNGNNLLFWSKLIDDREYGNANTFYPASKRVNIGLDIKF